MLTGLSPASPAYACFMQTLTKPNNESFQPDRILDLMIIVKSVRNDYFLSKKSKNPLPIALCRQKLSKGSEEKMITLLILGDKSNLFINVSFDHQFIMLYVYADVCFAICYFFYCHYVTCFIHCTGIYICPVTCFIPSL